MVISSLQRAIELAQKGTGFVEPNPKVGALILEGDQVVAEGYHEVYGGPHAEINALKNLNGSAQGLTMVVTLEPCSHFGKTPPCVDAIIDSGIKKVIVGMKDPNPLVAGKGLKKLKDAGIEVELLDPTNELLELNRPYLVALEKKRPFVTLKAGMTLDGKIASATYDSKWISNTASRQMTHELRQAHQAVLVSIKTVLRDDPSLSIRVGGPIKHPYKIVIDKDLQIPLDAKMIEESPENVILMTKKNHPIPKLNALRLKGVTLYELPLQGPYLNLKEGFQKLYDQGIHSVFIEAGHHLVNSLVQDKLVDDIIVFIAPKLIGGDTAPTLMGGPGIPLMKNAVNLELIDTYPLEGDVFIHYRIKEL